MLIACSNPYSNDSDYFASLKTATRIAGMYVIMAGGGALS